MAEVRSMDTVAAMIEIVLTDRIVKEWWRPWRLVKEWWRPWRLRLTCTASTACDPATAERERRIVRTNVHLHRQTQAR